MTEAADDGTVRMGRRSTDVKPADSSFKIAASSNINYAFILALLGGYGSGVWFFATQNATNAGVAERLARFEQTVAGRLDAVEKRDETRSAAVATIDNRLSRIEAQLSYLATNGARR